MQDDLRALLASIQGATALLDAGAVILRAGTPLGPAQRLQMIRAIESLETNLPALRQALRRHADDPAWAV